MTKFEHYTAQWTDERLQVEFLDYRRDLMTQAPGNLCSPCEDKLVYPHMPFSGSNYPYRDKIGAFQQAPWSDIMACTPEQLVEPNPHAPSRFRPGGYGCWDAAVGIPATNLRTAKVTEMRETPIVRNCNTYWTQGVMPALQNVGPTAEPGVYRRVTGEYVLDLTQIEDGWFWLEVAHALAHFGADDKTACTRWSKGAVDSKTVGWMQAMVAKMAVSWFFDLPMDTNPVSEGKYAEPDFPMVGLEVKSSSFYDTPFLRVPWDNNEALRFDETRAVMSVGVFVEPHPFGFITGTLQSESHDRWACAPTVAVIAGWESPDVICHQPLVSRRPYSKREPICYGVHPRDLLSPDLFWGYLRLWSKRQQELGLSPVPRSDSRRMRIQELLFSPTFERLIANSPPRSCQACMMWNPKTDNVPLRPKGVPPANANELARRENAPWRLYFSEVAAVHGIIDRAVLEYEYKLWEPDHAKRIRRVRTRNWKARLQVLKQQGYVDTARHKIRNGKNLTKWEERAFRAWQRTR